MCMVELVIVEIKLREVKSRLKRRENSFAGVV